MNSPIAFTFLILYGKRDPVTFHEEPNHVWNISDDTLVTNNLKLTGVSHKNLGVS